MSPKSNSTGLAFDLEKAIRLHKLVESGNFDIAQTPKHRYYKSILGIELPNLIKTFYHLPNNLSKLFVFHTLKCQYQEQRWH